METNNEFSRKIEKAQEQAESLQRHAEMSEEFNHLIAPEAIQAMRDILEDLHVAEEELRQSNEELAATHEVLEAEKFRYQEMFAYAPDGYLVSDSQGVIREANLKAGSLLGYATIALIGKPLVVFVAKGDKKTFPDLLSQLQEQDLLIDYQTTLTPHSGDPFPASISVAGIYDPEGDLTGLRWLIRDITERRRAEGLLQEEENKLRTLVQNLPVMVDALDENGLIKVWNRECERITGYSAAEMIDNPRAFERLYPKDSYREQKFVDLEKSGGDLRDVEWQLVCKDGSQRIVSWSNISARFPIPNWSTWAVGIDITERVQAREELKEHRYHLQELVAKRTEELTKEISLRQKTEQQLRASEEQYRRLVERSPDIVYQFSDNKGGLYYSPRTTAILGYEPDTLLENALLWHDSIHPDDLPMVDKTIGDIQVGEEFDIEYRIKDAQGEWHWFRDRSIGFRSQGEDAIVEGLATDITHRKDIEVQIRNYTSQLEALRKVCLNISRQLDPQTLLELIVSSAIELTSAENGGIYLYDSEANILEYVYGHGMEPIPLGTKLQCGEGLAGTIWENNQAMIVPDYPNWPGNLPQFAQLHSRSVMGALLQWGEEPLGVLNVAANEADMFTDQDLRILTLITAQASISYQNARYFEQIQTSRERYLDLSKRLASVQEWERRVVAHELHDEIGQDLTALMLRLDAHLEMNRETTTDIQAAKKITARLFEKVHNLSLTLRPSLLDDLGLLPTLTWLFQNALEGLKLHVNFEHHQLDQRFSAEIELAAFRIIQEAINNVARHTAVTQANVQIWVGDNVMQIQISDHGDGFDSQSIIESSAAGGLLGMSERTKWVGGQFEIDSASGQGTTILANLPLAGSSERRKDER